MEPERARQMASDEAYARAMQESMDAEAAATSPQLAQPVQPPPGMRAGPAGVPPSPAFPTAAQAPQTHPQARVAYGRGRDPMASQPPVATVGVPINSMNSMNRVQIVQGVPVSASSMQPGHPYRVGQPVDPRLVAMASQPEATAPTMVVGMPMAPAPPPDAIRLLGLFRLSRLVCWFSLFDVFLLVLWGFTLVFLFALLPMPVCGYLGAKRFRVNLLWVYAVFLVLEAIGRIVLVAFVDSLLWKVVTILGAMANVYIARLVTILIRLIGVEAEAGITRVRQLSREVGLC